jgi:cytochrome c oxidase subunit 4
MSATKTEHPSISLIAAVFIALLLLLGLTVGIAEINLGRWNFVAAMLIASAKATLIMLYFMQLRYARGLTWLFALGGFFWLAILIGLTFCDILTRS